MDITTQTNKPAQVDKFQHSGIFAIDRPSNGVVANMAGQIGQQLKQHSHAAQFGVTHIKPCITRMRLVMHDACVLLVQPSQISLDPHSQQRPVAEKGYFWKRNSGGFSNE